LNESIDSGRLLLPFQSGSKTLSPSKLQVVFVDDQAIFTTTDKSTQEAMKVLVPMQVAGTPLLSPVRLRQ